MTVTYSDEIATAKLSTLFKLLFFRWHGSLIKIVWRELLIYMSLYYLLHLVYRFGLSTEGRTDFEAIVSYLKNFNKNLPLAFLMGFFCQQVFTRWWDQYKTIPWPFSIAVFVSSTLEGYDEVGRALRRTIMRYVCLSLTMVFRVLSPRVKKRFPKIADLVEAGLITHSELQIILDMDQKFPGYSKNWLPLCWAGSLVKRARSEGRIKDDYAVMTIISEINKFRGACGVLMIYNQINIPLVYVHVVTIAVYTYFTTEMMAQQIIFRKGSSGSHTIIGSIADYIPFLFILQFLFYMGWLKVAETMMNPFGSDDDDFEVNYMIDRNLQMSYLIVDEMHNDHPELLKDQFWNKIPDKLPDKQDSSCGQKQKGERTDLFDVDSVVSKRRTILVDPEAGLETPTVNSRRSPSLIPRPTVISEIYQRKPGGVEVKPSNLELEIAKIHSKMQDLYDLIDRDSTELNSSSDDSDVTKGNLVDDDNGEDVINDTPKTEKNSPNKKKRISTNKTSESKKSGSEKIKNRQSSIPDKQEPDPEEGPKSKND